MPTATWTLQACRNRSTPDFGRYINSFWIRGHIVPTTLVLPPSRFSDLPMANIITTCLISTSFFMHLKSFREAHKLAKLMCDSPDTLSVEIWALNLECQKLILELRYIQNSVRFFQKSFINLLRFESLYHLFLKLSVLNPKFNANQRNRT